MLELFWEFHQQSRISRAEAAATQSGQKALEAAEEIRNYEDRIDKLTLISMALWSLLKETSNLTEEDLMNRIKEIDLSDGKLDGKVRGSVLRCPDCNRVMSNKHKRCLYCGGERPHPESVFDDITR